jgi:hypothetical protein
VWTAECQRAFEELKERLCFEPILTRYRPNLMCILDCNYQGQTLDAVLSQKHPGEKVERVLAYSSRTLKRAELKYSPTEGKLLALLHGLKVRQYLAGRSRFLVWTDHWALKWIQNHNPTSGRLARWLYEIDSHFIFNVEPQMNRDVTKIRHRLSLTRLDDLAQFGTSSFASSTSRSLGLSDMGRVKSSRVTNSLLW